MTTATKSVILFLPATTIGHGSKQSSAIVPNRVSLTDTHPNLDPDRLHQLGIESHERIRSIPIRDVRVGRRLPAHNPQLTDTERADFGCDIDPATWRTFTLEAAGTAVMHTRRNDGREPGWGPKA